MHRLVILGSLTEFVELVRLAGERGYYTIVCDGNPDGPAKALAHARYDIPVQNIEEIAGICRKEHADGIITSFSDLLLECMIKIADQAGLPCYLAPGQLPFYRDKSVMKNQLVKLGIPTPRFLRLSPDFPDEALHKVNFPLVTKPLDKYGSRGLFVVSSPSDLRAAYQDVCETSEQKEILAEEYNSGYEFNMMTWVHQGIVHVISVADREKTPVPTRDVPVNSRNVYPSCMLDFVLAPARDILQKYANSTGQTEGALSMQFFWQPGKDLEVGEIAARFFGYEHELVELGGGISIENLLLDSVYDIESLETSLALADPHLPTVSATLYFHGRERTIQCQQAARHLLSLPGVSSTGTMLFYREGEKVTWHGSCPYVARYYVTGKDRREVDQITERIFRDISVQDPDGEEILYRNRIPDYSL
ncbi:MAG: ATP-grasp domain-containing protein [Clostridiales bacterium]|nr:ATP-grasp domain-containing protein [Clostridiales bacterium]